MAAGTAAALVPIRSITRRMDPSSPHSLVATVKQHPKLSTSNGKETVTYIPKSQEEAGSLCVKLLTQLKGIQLGKVQDQFGWCFQVEEADGKKVVGENGLTKGTNGETVDQLD
jgi:branched-chain amino acid aminotransferase